ncbi:hypothetical protein J4212_05975 [Candidatus Woesearchaeota archaeon]|nr:hypothetical protein [Candidatus Woesearchaeota archaeon]
MKVKNRSTGSIDQGILRKAQKEVLRALYSLTAQGNNPEEFYSPRLIASKCREDEPTSRFFPEGHYGIIAPFDIKILVEEYVSRGLVKRTAILQLRESGNPVGYRANIEDAESMRKLESILEAN